MSTQGKGTDAEVTDVTGLMLNKHKTVCPCYPTRGKRALHGRVKGRETSHEPFAREFFYEGE
jgi:hypothetical protein